MKSILATSWRRISPLSPMVSFPIAWGIGVALGQIHLIRSQQNWSAEVWLVLAAVPATFVVGCLVGRGMARRARPEWLDWWLNRPKGPSRRSILVGCTVVGWLELIHQFAVAGSVPLFSHSIDAERFAQPGGPTVILTNLLAVAIIVALVTRQRLLAREARFDLAIVAVCLAGYALQGGRGSLLLPIAVAIIARWTHWGRPTAPVAAWVALGAVVLVMVSGLFYLRTAQENDVFQAELYGKVLPGLPTVLYPLVPVDLAYATNFQTLAAVVGHFPDVQSYGHGAYSASGLDLVFGSAAKDLSVTTSAINPPWTTATFAGPLWADGGLVIVAFGSALTGLLANLAYSLYRRTRQLRFALVSSYFLYLALFGVYTSLWTQQPDWLLITPGLFLAGTFAQREVPVRRIEPWVPAPPARELSERLWPPPRAVVLAAVGAVGFVALAGVVLAGVLPPGGARAPVVGRLPALFGEPLGPNVAVTDAGSSKKDSLLYRLERGDHGQTLLRVDGTGPDPERTLGLIAGRPRAGAGYDVYTPAGRSFPQLFQFRNRGRDEIAYTVSDTLTGRELDSGRLEVPKLKRGKRWLFVARWGGPSADLFIVDSGSPDREAVVSIRSGESGFEKRLARKQVVSPDLDPSRWQVDVFDAFLPPAGASRPDLVMSTNSGSLGHAEEHVLSGESGFKAFVQQRATEITAAQAQSLSFHAGLWRGAPAALSFDVPPTGSSSPIRAVQLFPSR